jgi:hypothetical protein
MLSPSCCHRLVPHCSTDQMLFYILLLALICIFIIFDSFHRFHERHKTWCLRFRSLPTLMRLKSSHEYAFNTRTMLHRTISTLQTPRYRHISLAWPHFHLRNIQRWAVRPTIPKNGHNMGISRGRSNSVIIDGESSIEFRNDWLVMQTLSSPVCYRDLHWNSTAADVGYPISSKRADAIRLIACNDMEIFRICLPHDQPPEIHRKTRCSETIALKGNKLILCLLESICSVKFPKFATSLCVVSPSHVLPRQSWEEARDEPIKQTMAHGSLLRC